MRDTAPPPACTPHPKQPSHTCQVANRSIALANIEEIAKHTLALNALPLRNDPSGCGRKLHNVRQGRLAPELREEAHSIVMHIIGDAPERAELLLQLQKHSLFT